MPSASTPTARCAALLRTLPSWRTLQRSRRGRSPGRPVSSGRDCHSLTSSSTPSVILLMRSCETSRSKVSFSWAWMSRTVIPRRVEAHTSLSTRPAGADPCEPSAARRCCCGRAGRPDRCARPRSPAAWGLCRCGCCRPGAGRVALLIAEVVGQLDRHRPLEDRLGHLLEQPSLAEELHTLLLRLRDQTVRKVLIHQPRLVSVTSRPAPPSQSLPAIQNFRHCLSSPSRHSGPASRSSPYTAGLTRPRPRPARPARPQPVAHRAQERARPPAHRPRSRPAPGRRWPTSRPPPGGRSPRCGTRSAATGRSAARSALAEARAALSAAGITLAAPRALPTLPGAVDAVLGWVVREATTNVLRHSGARTVTVTVGTDDDGAALTVDRRRARGGRGRREPGRRGPVGAGASGSPRSAAGWTPARRPEAASGCAPACRWPPAPAWRTP